MKVRIILLSILLLFSFMACDQKGHVAPNGIEKLNIVATTGMLGDAVIRIASDKAEVNSLMGPGVDPHYYKATQGDLIQMRKADLIVYNGLRLEGKMQEALENLGKSKPVIAAAAGIPPEKLRVISEGSDIIYDPHVWFDVSLWMEVIRNIEAFLSENDPSNSAFYQKNAMAYLEELDSLNSEIKAGIAEIPESQRVLITSHDAFGYFGRAYGMEVKGLQGVSTVVEFGLKDITDMVSLISERKIRAVFIESSVSPRAIEAVIGGCREKGQDVINGGTLYSDALGEKDGPAGTYIGMVRENLRIIVNALK